MNILQSLFLKENRIEVVRRLLSELNVDVTTTTLENDLINHPDYPKLLSISDVLTNYGIENASFQSNIEMLSELPVPFLAQIEGEDNREMFLTIVHSVENDLIYYYDPERHRDEKVSKQYFVKRWSSGLTMIVDAENAKSENDYVQKHRSEKRSNSAKYATYLSIPVLAGIASLLTLIWHRDGAIFPVLFSLFSLLGCIVGGLLFWYEIDQYNPVLQQICSGGKKISCAAILNSKASKIAGIGWNEIGFSYFTGCLFTTLFSGIMNVQAFFVLAWLNALALPYVFFSIYYQWRVAKQWCVLCLYAQALLVLQLIIATSAGWRTLVPLATILTENNIIIIILSFLSPFIAVSLLMPQYRDAKEGRRNRFELQRLKHNPEIFEALLAKQKTITESTDGLGIFMGNPNASRKIIKVCNPYCGPCANAHIPLEQLLQNNNDVQVQIIFTASNNVGDKLALPVKHLLAIAEKNDETIVKKALDDWYLADKKDYDVFALKYAMNGELKNQDAKVEAMRQWCEKIHISFTPTIFVSAPSPLGEIPVVRFCQLPEMYGVNDLKYFLSV